MKTTTNFGLKKPDSSDFFNVADQNDNMDKIDAELQKIKTGATKVGDADKLDGKDSSYFAVAENVYSKNETDNAIQDAIDGLETGETPIGNASQLEGHRADYFATAESVTKLTNGTTPAGKATDANKLGGETALQWQGKIDSIQTTSRATLSQAGWYRVAEYDSTAVDYTKGNNSNGCELVIKTAYDNKNAEAHVLLLTSLYGVQSIKSLVSTTKNTGSRLFSKCRYVRSGVTAYLEVYYALSESNRCIFEVNHQQDHMFAWKAITPVLTSETVSGVTVTTTYDIPANASPVTDLDLANYSRLTVSTVQIPSGADLNAYLTPGVYVIPSAEIAKSLLNKPPELIRGGKLVVENTNSASNIYQTIYTSQCVFIRYIAPSMGDFGEWYTYAKTADLANYFKNTGGIINDSVTIHLDDTSKYIAYYVENSLRKLELGIATNGDINFYDATHKMNIIKSKADGSKNTFNGTATGNLPLTGGRINQGQSIRYRLSSNTLNAVGSWFENPDGSDFGGVCAVGRDGVGEGLYMAVGPYHYDTSQGLFVTESDIKWKNNNILHTGNMADHVVPKNGDGEVTGTFTIQGKENVIDPLRCVSNHSTDKRNFIMFSQGDTEQGYLGFNGTGNPAFMHDGTYAIYDLLHSGNSAKVAIQSTAPTDGLWVW